MSKTAQIIQSLNISQQAGQQKADELGVGLYGPCDSAGNLADIPAGKLAHAELWATRNGQWVRRIATATRGFDGVWRSVK